MLMEYRPESPCLSCKIGSLHSKTKLLRLHRLSNTVSHGAEVDLIEVPFHKMQHAANVPHDGGNYQRGGV